MPKLDSKKKKAEQAAAAAGSAATREAGNGAPAAPAEPDLAEPKQAGPPPDAPLPEAKLYCKGSPHGPINGKFMKGVLGWVTEDEWKEEMKRRYPDQPAESFKFITEAMSNRGENKKPEALGGGFWPVTPILLTDHKGRKVWAQLNDNNRPFDIGHTKELVQEILTRRWAGPTAMPGETINGQTIVCSWPIPVEIDGETQMRKVVLDGQHSGAAVCLAYDLWADEDPDISGRWRALWPVEEYPDGPVIEKLVITGISPHTVIVRTMDNIRPRSLSDTIFTSDIFRDRSMSEKGEASRMLASSVDFLWGRLRVGNKQDGFLKRLYQTHATSHDWLQRHQRLLKCVENLFLQNRNRVLTKCKLSAGQCAAVMYLQASSKTNSANYHSQEEPSERVLNWDLWDKAAAFWAKLVDIRKDDKSNYIDKEAQAIRNVLVQVVEPEQEDEDDNGGLRTVTVDQKGGATRVAKMVVLSKAWALFKSGEPIKEDEIWPDYKPYDDGGKYVVGEDGQPGPTLYTKKRLNETSNFGGIDLGDDTRKKETSAGAPPITEEQSKEAAEKVRKARNQRKSEEKTEETVKGSMGMAASEKYLAAKKKHGQNRICLFLPKGSKRMVVYDKDADVLEKVCACSIVSSNGVRFTHQAASDVDDISRQLTDEGYQVVVIQEVSETEDKESYRNPVKNRLPDKPPHAGEAKKHDDPAAVAAKTRG